MTENGSAQPSPQPPTPGSGASRLDWAAVGALAAAVAAVVALVAYLVPPDRPPQPQVDPVVTTPAPQPPSPDPVATRPEPPDPSPSPENSTPQPPDPSPTHTVPATVVPLPTVRPGGCDEARTALAAYRRNAGATRGSQAAAAQQAYSDLMGAVLDAQGAVGATISRLAAEFQDLSFRLSGMVGGDPNEVISDINRDSEQLTGLCEGPVT
jgi:outer membrane biosynthesis protein TonB